MKAKLNWAPACLPLPRSSVFAYEMSKQVRISFQVVLPGKGGKRCENLITPFVYLAAYLLKDTT